MKDLEVLFPEPIRLHWKDKSGKTQEVFIEELSIKRLSHICVKIARITQKIYSDKSILELMGEKMKGLLEKKDKTSADINSIIGILIELIEGDMFELAAMLASQSVKKDPEEDSPPLDVEFVKRFRSARIATKILSLAYEQNQEIIKDFQGLGMAGKLGHSQA